MRKLSIHENKHVTIHATDMIDPTGPNHEYEIRVVQEQSESVSTTPINFPIKFQNGPIKEHGVNGIPDEALLAILIDRLQGFQKGPYNSRDNAIALTHLEEALLRLQYRTRQREARGVEGTSAV